MKTRRKLKNMNWSREMPSFFVVQLGEKNEYAGLGDTGEDGKAGDEKAENCRSEGKPCIGDLADAGDQRRIGGKRACRNQAFSRQGERHDNEDTPTPAAH